MNEQAGMHIDVQIDAKTMARQAEKASITKAAKLFDATSLKKMENALRCAPLSAKKLTKSEVLFELVPELKRQQECGHTAASLVAVLGASGLHVSERKLTQLLRQNHASNQTSGTLV